VATLVLPPGFVRHSRLARICPVYVGWVGRVGPEGTSRIVRMINGMFDPPRRKAR